MPPSSQQKRQQKVSLQIGFIQKYAPQYYTSILVYAVYFAFHFYFQRPVYFFAFIMMLPFLGKIMPKDNKQFQNPKYHNKNTYHALPLALNVICNLAFITHLCLYFPYSNMTGLDRFMTIFSIGLLTTPSINASHELIHRPQKILQILGFINMTVFFFNVYPFEHIYVHHKYVGTDKDPITSKKNYNLFFYLFRAYYTAHKFVFQFSKAIFLGCISLILAYIAIIYFSGINEYGNAQLAWDKLQFFLWIGLMGYLALQLIEYSQHYGLVYREDVDKKAINELSSWNTDKNMIHDWLVFRFQKHSDHHMNAYKYFTTLEYTEKMPKMPMTFFQALLICGISPLWMYIMNPYVEQQLQNKKVSESHKKVTQVVRYLIFLSVSAGCAYAYYVSVLKPQEIQ